MKCEYPRNYTGDVRVLRGGVREPLGHAEIVAKPRANGAYGGWSDSAIGRLEAWCDHAHDLKELSDLAALRGR